MSVLLLIWSLIVLDFAILLPYVILKEYSIRIIFVVASMCILSIFVLLALVLTQAIYTGILTNITHGHYISLQSVFSVCYSL